MNATLEIEAPASCAVCQLAFSFFGCRRCIITHRAVGGCGNRRHSDCPLKIVEKKKPIPGNDSLDEYAERLGREIVTALEDEEDESEKNSVGD